ncbi:regulator of Vps4 activity in the MVB pathway protein isoform X2 [Wolffia australiana]
MSSISNMFNRGVLGARCKTCLNLAISRIKLLRNKREVQMKQMRKEIAQYLQSGQEAIARIRVEHIIREENVSAAYEIVELFCEFVLARVPMLETQRDCPSELQEAIASIIYAAPRCSDLPELIQVRNLFTTKYGKDFVTAAAELRPDSNVNRMIIEKLSIKAPAPEAKLQSLRRIALEYSINWDASSTEIEFSKKHEDLLEGLTSSEIMNTEIKVHEPPIILTAQSQAQPPVHASSSPKKVNSAFVTVGSLGEVPRDTSDVLERARAAIAAAERASAVARSAAELVSAPTNWRAGNGK